MRHQKEFGQINKNEVKMDFKPKMVKGRTGWLVKGLVYAVLLGGSALATTSSIEASAAEWVPNTAEMIRANIKEGDNAYTFVQGDTFYEIGNAINVKYDVLMALNGFKEGSQYSIPVGTTISFDGNEVTITDKEGNVTNQQTLTDEAKINPSQPFMNQSSSGSGTTTKPVVTTPTNSNSGSTNNGGQSNNNGGQTNPTTPEVINPVIPVDPKPVDPNPVEPTTPEEINKIEALKAEIAAKKELLVSYQILLASNQENIDNYNQALSESQEALNQATQNQATAQENANALLAQSDALSNELADLQGAADNIGSQIVEAELNGEDTSALQAQLNNINSIIEAKTGDKANVDIQLNIANIELSNANTDLASQQTAVAENQQYLSELQAERESIQADITALESEIAELQAKLAELEGNVKPNPEPGIPVDPEVPGEGGEETDPEIPVDPEVPGEGGEETPDPENPELIDAQTAAIAELEGLNLTIEQKSSYVAAINGATTVAEVNTQVELAKADSEINNAQDEDAKKLAEAKKEALVILATLNLKDEADSFNEQISNAKSIDEVNTIMDEARAESVANDIKDKEEQAAKELAQAKSNAKIELNTLNLSPTEKSDFEARIDAAKDLATVNAVMVDARKQSDINNAKPEVKETITLTVNVFNVFTPYKTIELEVEIDENGYWEIDFDDLDMPGFEYASGNMSGYVGAGETTSSTIVRVKAIQVDWSDASVQAEVGQAMIDRINEERASEGLNPLIVQTEYNYLAVIRAEEINDLFDHKRPDGSGYYTVIDEAGLGANGMNGEVIQQIGGANHSPESLGIEIAERYLASPGHRAVLMNPNANYCIFSFYYDEETKMFNSVIILTGGPIQPTSKQ